MAWQWNYKIYWKIQKTFSPLKQPWCSNVQRGLFFGWRRGCCNSLHALSTLTLEVQKARAIPGRERTMYAKQEAPAKEEMLQCCLKNIFLWNSRQLERGGGKQGFCWFSGLKPFPKERAATYSSLRCRCTSGWSEEPASWQQALSTHTLIPPAQSACGIAGGF